MEIVPTSTSTKNQIGLEELILRKTELKQQIQDQKQLIASSTQRLFSPASITSFIFGSFRKNLNIVDSVLIGFKIISTVRKFIRKFR
jgi:hypothetical protein